MKRTKLLLATLLVCGGAFAFGKQEVPNADIKEIKASLQRIEDRQFTFIERISVVETKAVTAGALSSLLISGVFAIYLKTRFKEN